MPLLNKFYTANSDIVMAEILVEEISSGTTLLDTLLAQAKGRSPKKKTEDEDDDLDEEVAPKKGGKKAADDDDDIDDDDDFDGEEDDDDNWDPDFEEFDVPKSKKGKGKAEEEEDDDFKIEEEEDFSDMDPFTGGSGFDDDEEDY